MPKLRMPDLPPLLVGRGQLPPAIQWRLLDSLYGQAASFLVGTCSMLLVGLLWWARTRSVWALLWTAAFAAIALGRWLMGAAYVRNAHAGEPDIWARRFFAGACANGAVWGTASLVVVLEPDPFVQFLVITVQSGFLAGAVARNNVSPAAAAAQLLLARVPLLLACFATGNIYYACFALFVGLNIYGSFETIRHLGAQNLKLLLANGEKAELIDRLNRTNAELQSANRRLKMLAATDGLTGLINRRVFDTTLSREWYRSIRRGGSLSLLMVDIDCFKQFNDLHGHVAGDNCLKQVARATEATARRAGDVVARYGGEELAVLLPDTDATGAGTLAENVRRAVEALGVAHPASPAQCVTVSIGVGTMVPTPEITPEELVRRADTELYRAKRSGRNRVSPARALDAALSAAAAEAEPELAPAAQA